MLESRRITIIRANRPIRKSTVNDEIKWIANSLGLFGIRDKDSSCYRIFVELIKSVKSQNTVSSDEIAHNLGLSRATVIHHIKRLSDSGIIASEKNKYRLRVDNLEVLVAEIERDVERAFEDMKLIAKKIDQELGL
ncbi:HTH domain-containing protein [Candidatus Woesearchaeota archaeon]|nr:HTH domain-containing protein [Candidatus Woesearchaeota archaeon]